MYDRFQEAPEYRGARCTNCDLPITDENPEADVVSYTYNGVSWEKASHPGCKREMQLQAMENARRFLEHDMAQKGLDDPLCAEDAISELCEAFGFTYGVAANV